MEKITIQGFAYCKVAKTYEHGQSDVIDGFKYDIVNCDVSDWGDGYISAGKATLTIELPEGFDPRAGAVKTLEEQRKKIQAEFQARMVEIDRQISQFTAIECVA
jgi:ABC-type hemin transport system ATPase subunit